MDRVDVERFLQTMSPQGQVVFRSLGKDGRPSTISKEDALSNKDDNVYFLGGVRESAVKMTDNDIDIINYIRLDIDIYKGVKEFMGVESDTGDVKGFIGEIKEVLDSHEYLSEYSYIVFSGRGCHVYYNNIEGITIGDNVTPKLWSLAMKRIYSLFDKTLIEKMGESYEMLFSDKAVCNTARIMRLPGSINQKNGQECTIFHENKGMQSRFLGMVKSLGESELRIHNEVSKKRLKEIEELRAKIIADGGQSTDMKYEIINKFPAYLIAQLLLPQFIFDGKKNFKTNGQLKGFYYVKETNTICNGGSHEFNWGTAESCWNNYSLVKKHLGINDNETFKFFEEKFNI